MTAPLDDFHEIIANGGFTPEEVTGIEEVFRYPCPGANTPASRKRLIRTPDGWEWVEDHPGATA